MSLTRSGQKTGMRGREKGGGEERTRVKLGRESERARTKQNGGAHLFSFNRATASGCINRLEERLRAAILFHSADRKVSNDEALFIGPFRRHLALLIAARARSHSASRAFHSRSAPVVFRASGSRSRSTFVFRSWPADFCKISRGNLVRSCVSRPVLPGVSPFLRELSRMHSRSSSGRFRGRSFIVTEGKS